MKGRMPKGAISKTIAILLCNNNIGPGMLLSRMYSPEVQVALGGYLIGISSHRSIEGNDKVGSGVRLQKPISGT